MPEEVRHFGGTQALLVMGEMKGRSSKGGLSLRLLPQEMMPYLSALATLIVRSLLLTGFHLQGFEYIVKVLIILEYYFMLVYFSKKPPLELTYDSRPNHALKNEQTFLSIWCLVICLT